METTVLENQSFLDIVIQEDGSAEVIFEWALKNNKSITEPLTPGEKLINPNSELKNKGISNYFSGLGKLIATGLTTENLSVVIPDDGIGAMIIEDTFLVR